MDRNTTRRLSDAVIEALEAAGFGETFGVSVSLAGGTYDTTSATIKIRVAEIAQDGTVQTPERMDFERYARSFDLDPSMLDQTFTTGGKTYTVIGLKVKSRKYPVLARADDGKTYKFPAATVRALLAA